MESREPALVTIGWEELPPFLWEGKDGLTGFDVALLDEIHNRTGLRVAWRPLQGTEILKALADGEIDATLGIAKTPELEAQGYFTRAYRTVNIVLLMRAREVSRLEGETPTALFDEIRRKGLRIGVVAGTYYGPEAERFLNNPVNAELVVVATTPAEGVRLLSRGRVDALLSGRLVGLSAAALQHFGSQIEEHPVRIYALGMHAMFSRASTSPATVALFDRALEEIEADGTYAEIESQFVRPILLQIALSASWFTFLDRLGTVAFAISGVLLARKENYSIFGAFVLAALPAVGGSALRDLLIGRFPIEIVETPQALVLVLFTVVVGYAFIQLLDYVRGRFTIMLDIAWLFLWTSRIVPPRKAFEFFDALGLAAFTVTGVAVATIYSVEPLWLWGPVMAVLTGAGGCILRDIIRSDAHNPSLKTSFYAEINVIWGLLLSLYIAYFAAEASLPTSHLAVVVTVIGAFISRMAVIAIDMRAPRF
jgi:polar amino acid transport system substrate-binding protein